MPECHRPRTRHAGPPIVIPAKAGIPPNRHSGEGRNPEGRWEARPPPVLVRKHVPDSDPGCALQSTSMTALHRRNVPNCRPMADGGMRKCSAGACPPLGSGWGVAESTVPISCTKPQLRLFTPRCAGVRWNPLALVMPAPQSSFRRRACPVPDTGPESRGAVGGKTAASLGTKACPGLRSGIRGTSQTDESRSFRSSTICYPCARSVPAISLSPWERAGVRVKAGIGAPGQRKCRLWTRN